jgi:urease accessory protein
MLFEGDILRTAEGSTVRIICKAEPVVTAMADDWRYFARACYHFGNRHVPLQIGEKWLRFSPDPVLEKMAMHFGLEIRKECMPFAPESGAYHSHGRDAEDSPASC